MRTRNSKLKRIFKSGLSRQIVRYSNRTYPALATVHRLALAFTLGAATMWPEVGARHGNWTRGRIDVGEPLV
jgi:hypothetical protein